ncbi:MAG TPA: hypothetical protein VF209_00465 [Patescibacteria group bacterium]
MSRLINFVQERQKKLTTQEIKDRQLFKIGAIVFGVVLVGYVAAFGAYLFLQYQMKNVQDQQLSLERSILAQGEVEKSAAILLEKISVISELMAQRADKQTAIAYFSDLFGPTVLIKEMNFNPDSSSLELNVETTSLFTLRELFSILDSDNVSEQYADVTREELRRQSDATYQLKLGIPLLAAEAKK